LIFSNCFSVISIGFNYNRISVNTP
jgi:hypothetical protein